MSLSGALGTAAATGASAPAAGTATTAPNIIENASAAFDCRSSVARVEVANQNLLEPAVAGNSTSCPTDDALVQSVPLLGSSSSLLGQTLNLGSVGPAGAYTFASGSIGTGTAVGGTSVTNVTGVSLSLMGYTLTVAGPIESQAYAFCAQDPTTGYYTDPETYGTADINALTITGPGLPSGGQTIELGSALNTVVGNLPAALSALISIKANEVVYGTDSVTADLLDISLLGAADGGVHVVLGESIAGFPNNNAAICAQNVPTTVNTTTTVTTGTNGTPTTVTNTVTNTTTSPATTVTTGANGTVTTVTTPGATTVTATPAGTVPTFLEECATGSTLDPSTGDCVIYDNGTAVFVSKPFKGPTGGTVVTLPEAKAKYHSPCLSGAGPDWVLLVTTKNGVAKGTPLSDRILGLNTGQRISGLAGNDCIDEMKSTGHINDGNGKDRIYVSSGVNRVIAGNGNNTIHGGKGRNWITDGTGDDYIYGGSLPNRIDAYGNMKHIFGGSSNDRIWTNSQIAKVSCGGGTANILFARKHVAAYGAKHGCQKVRLLS